MTSRRCPSCGHTFPPEGFYRRSNGRLQHACKGCMKAAARRNNRERLARIRAEKRQQREYARFHMGAA